MSIATHPRAYATVTGPTATVTFPDGHQIPLTAPPDEDIRHTIVRRTVEEARRAGSSLELVTAGDRGEHHLLITTDGARPATSAPAPQGANTGEEDDPDLDDFPILQVRDEVRGEEVRMRAQRLAATPTLGEPAAEPPTRPSFLTTPVALPVQPGVRGLLARLGIRVRPSRAEEERQRAVAMVSRQWAGCRTIAVVNGKGGVGKTMTTAMLAAVYGRHGGGNVLAWDNNDTRGTLGWRTEQGLYDTTVRDLLPAATDLLAASAGVSDIARFVHHQAVDRYDVLRSNPELLATDQRIAADEFDLLMQVAARYYRLVVFDSGNDESADRWLRMIDSSYQLVIPTLPSPESAESAALLLDALHARDHRSSALAANAVVIVTQHEPTALTAARRVAAGFQGHVRAVELIPYDPALKTGHLRFDTLHSPTRNAWIHAAASAAETL